VVLALGVPNRSGELEGAKLLVVCVVDDVPHFSVASLSAKAKQQKAVAKDRELGVSSRCGFKSEIASVTTIFCVDTFNEEGTHVEQADLLFEPFPSLLDPRSISFAHGVSDGVVVEPLLGHDVFPSSAWNEEYPPAVEKDQGP